MVKAEPLIPREAVLSTVRSNAAIIERLTIRYVVASGIVADLIQNMERFGDECGSPSVKAEVSRFVEQLRYLIGNMDGMLEAVAAAGDDIWNAVN